MDKILQKTLKMKGRIEIADWSGTIGAHLGLDMMDYGVTPCPGFCNVPFGPHLLRVGNVLAPQLIWLWVDASTTVHRLRWDALNEELVIVEENAEKLRLTNVSVEDKLAQYAQQDDSWVQATCHMDENVTCLAQARLPLTRRKDADRTPELLGLSCNVLGLLQRSFLEFSLAHDMDSFECWRDTVILMCQCPTAMTSHPVLLTQMVRVVTWQMRQAGPEVLWGGEGGGSNNVFVHNVSIFCRDALTDPDVEPSLQAAARDLATVVGVDAWDVDPEDEPVVVEL
jgi:hypothetical protein